MKVWLALFGFLAAIVYIAPTLLQWRTNQLEKDTERLMKEMMPSLLFIQGGDMPPEQVDEQERILENDPNNMKARCLLLGYYGDFARRNESYREHVLWVIENMPEHPIVRECEFFTSKDSHDAYQHGKELWLRHLQTRPKDPVLLKHAARYFLLQDRAIAEKLLQAGKALQPNNPDWSERLAHLYDLGLEGMNDSECALKALNEQERVFKLCRNRDDRIHALEDLPKLSFKAMKYEKSSRFANQLLAHAQQETDESQASDCKHKAHSILGRLALKNGNIDAARFHLLSSADVQGSPVLHSFGPNMRLAKELLESGQQDAVLEYLDRCEVFWEGERGRLPAWRKEIQDGSVPSDWSRG